MIHSGSRLFIILSFFMMLTNSVVAKEADNTTLENNYIIDHVNVRFSIGYRDQLDKLLAATITQLNVEQAKLDEARSRRKSVSKAMQKMIVKVRTLTARKDFIENEIKTIPLEIKAVVEEVLETVIQGERRVTLNIQIGAFSAAKKRENLWVDLHNSIAGTVVVIDNENNEILTTILATDIDSSQYSANTAAFIEGIGIGAAGVFGLVGVKFINSLGAGRSDMIENFAERTVSALFPEMKTNIKQNIR